MQAKDPECNRIHSGTRSFTRRSLDTTQIREEGVSLDPLGEQSGTSQISHNSSLTLESGEGGPIYSLSHEGVQQEATQGGIHPADPVVPHLAGGSTACAYFEPKLFGLATVR